MRLHWLLLLIATTWASTHAGVPGRNASPHRAAKAGHGVARKLSPASHRRAPAAPLCDEEVGCHWSFPVQLRNCRFLTDDSLYNEGIESPAGQPVSLNGSFLGSDEPAYETGTAAPADTTKDSLITAVAIEPLVDFGATLSCTTRDTSIEIHNVGTDTFRIVHAVLVDASGQFALIGVGEHMTRIVPGASFQLFLRAAPFRPGDVSAHVELTLAPTASAETVVTTRLHCSAFALEAGIRAASVTVSSADTVLYPVELDRPLDDAFVTELTAEVTYDPQEVTITASGADAISTAGTLCSRWKTIVLEETVGRIVVRLVNTVAEPRSLHGSGTLFRIPLWLHAGRSTGSSICARVAVPDTPCVSLTNLCGGVTRSPDDFVTGGADAHWIGAAVDQAGTAITLRFALAEAGSARLEVYSVDGRLVRVLVDGPFDLAGHAVVWNVGDVPVGLYFYRLVVGGTSLSGPIMVWHR